MTFTRVLPAAELWDGEKLGIELSGRPILLVRIAGEVHAYDDHCQHKRARLSPGCLTGHVLRCPVHAWEYDLTTGASVNPRGRQLARFPVCERDGAIWIDVGAT